MGRTWTVGTSASHRHWTPGPAAPACPKRSRAHSGQVNWANTACLHGGVSPKTVRVLLANAALRVVLDLVPSAYGYDRPAEPPRPVAAHAARADSAAGRERRSLAEHLSR